MIFTLVNPDPMSLSFQWTEGLFCDLTWLVLMTRHHYPSLSTPVVKRWPELGAFAIRACNYGSLLLKMNDLAFLWNPVFNVDLKLL